MHNKVVAIKYTTNNKGFYDIPGGKIEDNETSIDAAIREFKEETTIDIRNPKYADNLIVEYPNKEYNKIQTLSNNLTNVDEQLKDKNKKIKTLTKNNKPLNLRVKTLNDTIKEKDNEISFLKSKINGLKDTLNYWKDKFSKLIYFLHSKLHSWFYKDDKYINVVNDMYEDNILDEEDIEDLDLNKEKDDFER